MAHDKDLNDKMTTPEPRLIAHVISQTAKATPAKIWGSLPKSDFEVSEGYEDITFARLNYAVTRACQWLVSNIEPHRQSKFEALAYIGPPDSRYITFSIAAIKTGFQMLFLSPRNSDEAQQSVICEASCQKFLCSTSMETRVKKLIQSRSRLSTMSTYVVPEQQDLLREEIVPDYPYEKTLEQARYEPLVILHTSSTTGMPKTIPLNQGYGLHEDVVQHVPKFNGLDIITRKPFYGTCRMFVAMPLFHAGGVLLTLLKSLYHDIVSVFQPPLASLNADVFDGILRFGGCTGCVIPPYLLEEMLAVPAFFDTLAGLDFVQFGSGPLSTAAGDQLLTRQKDCPHYIGSSECGLYILLELDDPIADWRYFRFHPFSGVEMRRLDSENDMPRELYIVRTAEGQQVPGMQPVFELFPNLQEWPTKDLYERHPTKPDHWRCIGRNDDVLVLSNGEKLNPVDTESRVINSHTNISGALVIGQGQFAPGLLIEVRGLDVSGASQRASLIEDIWPSVQASNKEAAGHAQLSKSLILFTSPSKPFLRTPKLSVRRKPTIDSYTQEIDQMYKSYMQDLGQDESGTKGTSQLDLHFQVGIQDFVRDSIASVTGWEDLPGDNEDLFMLGMDSLQAVRIARAIRLDLSRHEVSLEFTPRHIYNNPTMLALSQEIRTLLQSSSANVPQSAQPKREEVMEKLIKEYSNFSTGSFSVREVLNVGIDQSINPNSSKVILTGTTGSLGSYILVSLLKTSSVQHVYCLNRSASARDQFMAFLKDLGVYHSENWDDRVSFFNTPSLALPHLGLEDKSQHDTLLQADLTHVIHNAWPVNFNLAIASFTSHLAGVRALIEFCCHGNVLSNTSKPSPMPAFTFVSSLSSVTNLSSSARVPESIVEDTSAPAHTGYGESKHVAERILNEASKQVPGFSTTILRIGQIAGPAEHNSIWPAREWLPSLIISSKSIDALPSDLGRMNDVDWIPVDTLADCISEIVLDCDSPEEDQPPTGNKSQCNVYHVLNPQVTSWQSLLPITQRQTGITCVKPLRDWIELVQTGPDVDQEASGSSVSGGPNPAKKILQFYQGLQPSGETERDSTDPIDKIEKQTDTNAQSNNGPTGVRPFQLENMARRSSTFRSLKPVSSAWLTEWIDGWL